MTPRRALVWARRVVLGVACAGVAFLWWRFDFLTLPAEGCSPLVRFSPGDRLIVDRRPVAVGALDAVFFEAQGRVHLGLVERSRADGSVWVVTDDPVCPGESSERLGWLAPGAVVGRVVMVWPW